MEHNLALGLYACLQVSNWRTSSLSIPLHSELVELGRSWLNLCPYQLHLQKLARVRCLLPYLDVLPPRHCIGQITACSCFFGEVAYVFFTSVHRHSCLSPPLAMPLFENYVESLSLFEIQ